MRLIDADVTQTIADTELNIEEAGKVQHILSHTPTINPEDIRPKGRWIECDYVEYDEHGECIHYPKEALKCSNCCNAFKKKLLWKRNYCPNCGAKME